jgi:hypothetical protein
VRLRGENPRKYRLQRLQVALQVGDHLQDAEEYARLFTRRGQIGALRELSRTCVQLANETLAVYRDALNAEKRKRKRFRRPIHRD